MKTKLLTIVCILLLATNSNLWAVEYINLNTASGNINISAIYTNNVYKVWDINTGQTNKPVLITYNIDIEEEWDYIYIYSINEDGDEDYEMELTGKRNGSYTTAFPNGKARIMFYTGASNCYSNGGFAPSSISFNIDVNSSTASNLFLDENAFIKGKVGVGMAPYTGKLGVSNNAVQTGTPYGIYSSSYNNAANYAYAYGIYSNATAYGTNSRAYGLSAYAYGANATSTVYGIYSNVGGVSGAAKRSGYFTGGDMELNGANLIIARDANRQFIFHTAWQTGEPATLMIAPKIPNSIEWDWSKQITIKNDGSLLTRAGRLGVCTDNPQATLDVNGNILSKTSVAIEGNSDIGSALALINAAKTQPGTANTWRIYNMTGTYGNSLQFYAYDNIGCVPGGLCHSRFVLMDNGNVGIGTNSPDYLLDVNGTIRAKEVKINLNDGADFVFAQDYKLMNLTELDNFVTANKRLPEIPSAADMVSEGVDMGEFQVKLLQKIEELTLYIIDQNKEMQVLKNKVNELENK